MANSMVVSSGFALPQPADGLSRYIDAVRAIPVLDADTERNLARRLRDHNDLDAARGLILPHLRFVVHVARSYSGYGLALADLIQEGNIGLMKAVKRFDPDVGVRLISFAVHWIRAEIHEFVLRNWRIVKVATTKAQRKLFFNLRKAKQRLGWFSADEVDAVAEDLGVKPETVREMESRLSGHDVTFDARDSDDEDGAPLAPATWLAAERDADPAYLLEQIDWDSDSRARLAGALQDLDDRSRKIIETRWLTDKKQTLHELADEFGVSAERIRQLEAGAIKKLRNSLLT